MNDFDTYEQLQSYLRNFRNFRDELGQYDFNGLLRLMISILDNLRANTIESDFEEIGDAFDGDQTAFFLRLAEFVRNRNPPEM